MEEPENKTSVVHDQKKTICKSTTVTFFSKDKNANV